MFDPSGCLVSITMKEVTSTLDEETAAWARIYAAERNISLSSIVGGLLRNHRYEWHDYEESLRRFLAQKPVELDKPGDRYPTRDETQDRTCGR